MAKKATVTVHPNFEIGEISNRLFSAFLEPIGSMVNGTMFNPKHPTADEQGFRTDFIKVKLFFNLLFNSIYYLRAVLVSLFINSIINSFDKFIVP